MDEPVDEPEGVVEITPKDQLIALVTDEHYDRIVDGLIALRSLFIDEDSIFAHINAIGNIMQRLKVVATYVPPVVEVDPGFEVLPPDDEGWPDNGTEDDPAGDTGDIGDNSPDP